jgi:hypothetical protein
MSMQQTVEQISDFIKAPKPKNFTAYHLAIMLCLMTEKPPIKLSQTTIAGRTGMSRPQVTDITAKLREWKWIKVASGKRRQDTNLVEIMYANLPVSTPPAELVISERAVKLAEGYKNVFKHYCTKYINKKGRHCTRPLRKDWKTRWEPIFQLRLNEGYTYNEMAEIINTAAKTNPKKLVAGPQSRNLFPKKEASQVTIPTTNERQP